MGVFIQPFCVEDQCSNNMIEIEISIKLMSNMVDRSLHHQIVYRQAQKQQAHFQLKIFAQKMYHLHLTHFLQREEKFQLTIQTFHHQQLQKQVQEIFSKKLPFICDICVINK